LYGVEETARSSFRVGLSARARRRRFASFLFSLFVHGAHGKYAVQSISTSAFRGRVLTANVARAGGFSGKRLP
jgi:hypothetical protein